MTQSNNVYSYIRKYVLMPQKDLPRIRDGYQGEDYFFRVISIGPISDERLREMAFKEIWTYLGDDAEDAYVLEVHDA